MKPVRFHKMHAAGNDFIILQRLPQDPKLSQVFVAKLCDRRLGVGCDQLLVITPSAPHSARFNYQIYNADGLEVGQCGNGARCLGEFIRRFELCQTSKIELATQTGIIEVELSSQPCKAKFGPITVQPLAADTAFVDLGNPHWVKFVPNIAEFPLASHAAELQQQYAASRGINVEIVSIVAPNQVTARVFERGVGETPACGSGAVAIAAAGERLGLLNTALTVAMPGGKLSVDWDAQTSCAWLSGATHYIFAGEYYDD